MPSPLLELPHTTWGDDVLVLLLRDAQRLQFCQMSHRSYMPHQGPEPLSHSENSHFFSMAGLHSAMSPKLY